MTWFHGVQLAYWMAALWWGGRQVRALLFDAALGARAIVARVEECLPRGRGAALELLTAARPAWVARVGIAYLRPQSGRVEEGEYEAQDLLSDLHSASVRGVGSLVTMGRIASPLAFLGVIMELTTAFGGGGGLEALQRGLPEQLALGRAATGVTLGVMTMLLCFSLAQILSRQVQRLTLDATRMQEALGRGIAAAKDA